MHTINLQRARECFKHIDLDNLHGRPIPMHPVFESGKWNLWLPIRENDFIQTNCEDVVDGLYFSDSSAGEYDVYLMVINFLEQKAISNSTKYFCRAMYEDIYNLSASIEKLDLIHKVSVGKIGVSRLATTELEYIYICSRSLFDLFQEIISRLWDDVKKVDMGAVKKKLPKSFSDIVYQDNKLMSAVRIAEKFKIPENVALAYEKASNIFQQIKNNRDLIAHGGKSIEIIYNLDCGFAVPTYIAPFDLMDIWTKENTKDNNLGSLKSFVYNIVYKTLEAIEIIIIEYGKVIEYPPPIAPNHSVYMRGIHFGHFKKMKDMINGNSWVQ